MNDSYDFIDTETEGSIDDGSSNNSCNNIYNITAIGMNLMRLMKKLKPRTPSSLLWLKG
jgi:hypothetical protein